MYNKALHTENVNAYTGLWGWIDTGDQRKDYSEFATFRQMGGRLQRTMAKKANRSHSSFPRYNINTQ